MLTIISGGQTGVDRAALDSAQAAGVPVSGWCPAGRQAEDGPIAGRYPLTSLPGGDYAARTERNVLDADATLIIFFSKLYGGSALTRDCCRRHHRPCLLVDVDQQALADASRAIVDFLARHRVQRLNVAGPRASEQPSAYPFTRALLARVLSGQAPISPA